MYLVGKPTECTVVLSNTDLRVYRENCPKDVEKLDMKNHSATKYFTKVPMLGASRCIRTTKVGHFPSRICEVITIKPCIGDVEVDLFFDGSGENEEAWKKCIDGAIGSSATHLNPLMLARQQIGLCHKKLQLRRQRSKSEDFQSEKYAKVTAFRVHTV